MTEPITVDVPATPRSIAPAAPVPTPAAKADAKPPESAPAPGAPSLFARLAARVTRKQAVIGASAVFSIAAGALSVRFLLPPDPEPRPAATQPIAPDPKPPAKSAAVPEPGKFPGDNILPAVLPVAPSAPPSGPAVPDTKGVPPPLPGANRKPEIDERRSDPGVPGGPLAPGTRPGDTGAKLGDPPTGRWGGGSSGSSMHESDLGFPKTPAAPVVPAGANDPPKLPIPIPNPNPAAPAAPGNMTPAAPAALPPTAKDPAPAPKTPDAGPAVPALPDPTKSGPLVPGAGPTVPGAGPTGPGDKPPGGGMTNPGDAGPKPPDPGPLAVPPAGPGGGTTNPKDVDPKAPDVGALVPSVGGMGGAAPKSPPDPVEPGKPDPKAPPPVSVDPGKPEPKAPPPVVGSPPNGTGTGGSPMSPLGPSGGGPAAPTTPPDTGSLLPATPVKPVGVGPVSPVPDPKADGGAKLEFVKPANNPAAAPVGNPERPPTTSYDVDIHHVKAGDTWEAVSREFYGDARHAAALAAYNRNKPLRERDRVDVPPLHVVKRYAPGAAAAPARPAAEWGAPAGRATGGDKTFRVPQGGLTMRGVAQLVLGNGGKWDDIHRLNPHLRPDEPLAAGTELRLPPEARLPD